MALTFFITEAFKGQKKAQHFDNLVDRIQQFFQTDPILSSETPPNPKDLLCAMADMDKKQITYDYWDLTFFRNRDCSTITVLQYYDEEDKARNARKKAQRGG